MLIVPVNFLPHECMRRRRGNGWESEEGGGRCGRGRGLLF